MSRSVAGCIAVAVACSSCAVAGSTATTDASSHDLVDGKLHEDAAHTTGGDGSSGPPSGCTMTFTGALAMWDFASGTGSQTSTPSSSSALGATAAPVTRASGLTPVAGSGSINSSGWATSATVDTSKYYSMSITPPTGCSLAFTGATVDAKASGSGPQSASIATSADNFASTSPVTTSAASSPSLSVSGATGMVELRIYGYDASSAAGTLRLQNTLTVTGSVE